MKKLIVWGVIVSQLLLVSCMRNNWSNGNAVMLTEPVWVIGVKDEQVAYTKDYPEIVKSEHFEVVNAGYWIATMGSKTIARYEFTLTVTSPFPTKVYTRTILSNPKDLLNPIQYEHYLNPEEKSTRVFHGPLSGIVPDEKYKLTLEVFKDKERTVLLEQVTQEIVAGFDTENGCVSLTPELEDHLFGWMKESKDTRMQADRINLACGG